MEKLGKLKICVGHTLNYAGVARVLQTLRTENYLRKIYLLFGWEK
jgi:hypothetical protein